MRKTDLYRQVAQLHIANINQGFLATLGEEFVSLMYQAIDKDQNSILLVEERDGHVVGFVSGGLGMGSVYRQMLRSPFRLGWSLLPSMFRPRRILRIIEILRYSRGAGGEKGLPATELLSIAVASSARGTGVAESLYRRLATAFHERGLDAFKITVGDSLAPAHRFYRRMGAEPAGKIEVHRGESSTVYVHRTK